MTIHRSYIPSVEGSLREASQSPGRVAGEVCRAMWFPCEAYSKAPWSLSRGDFSDESAFLNPSFNTPKTPIECDAAAPIGPHGHHIGAIPLHMVGSIVESRDMDELANLGNNGSLDLGNPLGRLGEVPSIDFHGDTNIVGTVSIEHDALARLHKLINGLGNLGT